MKNLSLAGFAPLATIADHWRVTSETAKALLAPNRVRVMRRAGRDHVCWLDIWRIEGVLSPEPSLFNELQLRLLTRDDIAARYGVSPRTARRWMAAGEVPTIKLGPRILRARESELDRQDALRLGVIEMA